MSKGKIPDPWKSYFPILLGFWSRGLTNHGNRGDRPRKGLFCLKEGAGLGFLETQINIVIFMGIKYAEHKHELLNPISEIGISV